MRHIPIAQLNTFVLDANKETPLYYQLYLHIRQAILKGQLAQGLKLPSSRILAKELKISRNTALSAYEQLLAEGFIESRKGSGSYVCENLPEHLSQDISFNIRLDKDRSLSHRGKQIAKLEKSSFRKAAPFAPGVTDLAQFPFETWARLISRHWRHASANMLSYSHPAGFYRLRKTIAEYLRNCRAVRCCAEEVMIVTGSQQALDLVARMLIDPGEKVWLEEPCYNGAKGAFIAAGAEPVYVPVDEEGLQIDIAEKMCQQAKLAFITPSSQYPLGVTLSLARRLKLLQWAQNNNAWIIEDDYDNEYRYRGRPLASLQGLDPTGRVIYIGTFSKVLFSSLRIGYLVVPKDLTQAFCTARSFVDSHPPTVTQAALADFIEKGYFSSHIRRLRLVYQKRQKEFIELANRHLSKWLVIAPQEAGMHVVGYMKKNIDDQKITHMAAEQGLVVPALSSFYSTSSHPKGLVLGYAGFHLSLLEEAIFKLRKIFEKYR